MGTSSPANTVTDRDRRVAQQLAEESAAIAERRAKDQETVRKAKELLVFLAGIAIAPPRYAAEYTLSRGNQRGKITPAQIEAARACVADRCGDPPRVATVGDCLAALKPLARLPRNYGAADPKEVQFAFPAENAGKDIEITLATIMAAEDLCGGAEV